MRITALKVITPVGECYAVFPDDAIHCELKGLSTQAISFFESSLHKMFKPHGYPVELQQLEPEELEEYCSRSDLGISIQTEFSTDELEVIII